MKFQATQISLLVSGLFMVASVNAQQSTTDVGTINVEGQPGGTATGLIQQEETPKARSSVGRKAIENLSPTSNPYQVINLLPGVSTFSYDGTGLFGGGLRIRGFNSDQLGFTIDGVPVNDSGSFTVFPQEYTDTDNLCEVFVTQGSTDTEAPHVGATGGNVGLVTCAPTDKRRVRVSQTLGNNALSKTFLRYDTGKFADDRLKMFFSVSHAEAEKFKGKGDAYREHIDYKADLSLGGGSSIGAGFLYNRAVNNNYRTLTKAQIDQQGRYLDFGTIAPVHVTPGPGAQVDNAAGSYNVVNGIFAPGGSATNANGYYGFNLNPFRNYIATLKGHFQLAPTLSLDVDPYFWYGYGTGGNELQTLREGQSGSFLHGGGRDYNGDGDKLDTIAAYEGSITKTYRPGVTTKVNWQIAGNRILAGYWYERARHQQTAPYVQIDNNGNAADIWLRNPDQWLKNADGSPANFRDWYTISTGKSAFIQDTVSFFQDKLTIQGGGRYTTLGRLFRNSANQGTTVTGLGQTGSGGVDYTINKDYSEFLPNIGIKYQLTTEQSLFANATKNFKAPPNFVYSNLAVSNASATAPVTFVNGVATNFRILEPQVGPETAHNYDAGYRYAGDRVTFSGSVFYVNYKGRIASLIDPNTGQQGQAINLGDSTTRGFELESGYSITKNLSAYGSLSYTKTRIRSDIAYGGGLKREATAGKEFPDTPKWLSGFALQYSDANWIAGVDAKYTGKRYSTLVNDDSIGGYTLFGVTAGYKLPSNDFFKNPIVRLNVYNVFSRQYLSLNGPSGSNFGVRANPIVGLPTYFAQTFYVGAPRTVVVTLASDF